MMLTTVVQAIVGPSQSASALTSVPQSYWWGVDTALPLNASMLSQVENYFQGAKPTFWGRYVSDGFQLTSSEVQFAHQNGIYLYLLVADQNNPANGLCGANSTAAQATTDANTAATNARNLGVPGGTMIYKDFENGCPGDPSSAYIVSWYQTMSGDGYGAGFYGNSYYANNQFPSAYCGDQGVGALTTQTRIAASEPEPQFGPTAANQLGPGNQPTWGPDEPPCQNQTDVWQYSEPGSNQADPADLDESLANAPGFWAPNGSVTPYPATTQGSSAVEFQRSTGDIWGYTGTPCGPSWCSGWAHLADNPATTSVIASPSGIYAFQAATGSLWESTGQPCYSNGWCPGWVLLDNNPNTTAVYAGGSGVYELQGRTGQLWKYTGQPCGSSCYGWSELADNPATTSVAVSSNGVYAFQAATGNLWEATGQPCYSNGWCPGWVLLDNNPNTTAVYGGGSGVYEFQATTGQLWKSTGQACNGFCGGWTELANNQLTTSVAVDNSTVYALQGSTGELWRSTGASCNGFCGGWQQLDNNPRTTNIYGGASGVYEFQATTGQLWKSTGQICSGFCGGWTILDNNPSTTAVAVQ